MGACIITFRWLLAPSISEYFNSMLFLTQQSSALGFLGFRRDPVFSAEVFHAPSRINHCLLSGVIGMTLRANFNTYLRFRRNSFICCTAYTIDDTFHCWRMNICFHADNYPLWNDTYKLKDKLPLVTSSRRRIFRLVINHHLQKRLIGVCFA